jgi:very-short-patch-repair endonuclease
MEDEKNKMHLNASPQIFRQAKQLRKRMTKAEEVLWEWLRDKKLDGYKFRRQHPMHRFILDFYCHSNCLIIELDGKIHNEKPEQIYDEARTKYLSECGMKVIRFKNEEVFNDIENVINKIRIALHST